VIEVEPLKVSTRSLPATMSAPAWRSAMWAAPMRSGVLPSSFDTRMRTCLPPMLVCTIRRRVWSLKVWVCAGSGGPAGAVPQVPTHCWLVSHRPWSAWAPSGSARPASASVPAASSLRSRVDERGED